MSTSGPPAYAWDWFSRQRLLWRETRSRLAARGASDPVGARYGHVAAKPDVIPMLRADYPDDAIVRDTVHAVISDVVFLGRTDVPFAELQVRHAPRGLRWWWRALTGEEIDGPPAPASPARAPAQLQLDDVLDGYGDY